MDSLIAAIEAPFRRKTLPSFRVGDTLRVHQRIREGGKERIQVFEGLVIAKKHGTGMTGTFTVRRIASGVGVERVFPLHTPLIAKIERVRSAKVRRGKLYFLRGRVGKKARLKGIESYASWSDEETGESGQVTGDSHEKTETAETPPIAVESEEQSTKEEPRKDTDDPASPDGLQGAGVPDEVHDDNGTEGSGGNRRGDGGESSQKEGPSDPPKESSNSGR
ncbi:50S ribosomal protein L19 [Candidatus Berkelbacteria bacterium]|nr:50S ribosomal protein L19 [Candidatus Berkelbacteria bacterium]